MPWFDPVFHPPRPEARIGDKGKMTAGPSLEEGHSEGECRRDTELGEGCPGHDRQRHRVYRPIREPGNQNDQGDQPPIDRLPSIESRRDALQPDAPRREEPEQNSDGNGDPMTAARRISSEAVKVSETSRRTNKPTKNAPPTAEPTANLGTNFIRFA